MENFLPLAEKKVQSHLVVSLLLRPPRLVRVQQFWRKVGGDVRQFHGLFSLVQRAVRMAVVRIVGQLVVLLVLLVLVLCRVVVDLRRRKERRRRRQLSLLPVWTEAKQWRQSVAGVVSGAAVGVLVHWRSR